MPSSAVKTDFMFQSQKMKFRRARAMAGVSRVKSRPLMSGRGTAVPELAPLSLSQRACCECRQAREAGTTGMRSSRMANVAKSRPTAAVSERCARQRASVARSHQSPDMPTAARLKTSPPRRRARQARWSNINVRIFSDRSLAMISSRRCADYAAENGDGVIPAVSVSSGQIRRWPNGISLAAVFLLKTHRDLTPTAAIGHGQERLKLS